MTIIDTTLYANGALRLSRHGAGRGGNILVHIASGAQIEIAEHSIDGAVYQLEASWDTEGTFNYLSANYSNSGDRVYEGKRYRVVEHQIVEA